MARVGKKQMKSRQRFRIKTVSRQYYRTRVKNKGKEKINLCISAIRLDFKFKCNAWIN